MCNLVQDMTRIVGRCRLGAGCGGFGVGVVVGGVTGCR